MGKKSAQNFGGNWTAQKLAVVDSYLHSYTTALKDTPFKKAYIDAFAGTGYLELKAGKTTPSTGQVSFFPDLAEAEPQQLLDGSARLALKVTPRFDKYVFIERNAKRCEQLEQLKSEFPALSADIEVRNRDANTEIQDICQRNWQSHRAVLFLDPFGMQVEWRTIEAIAGTRAIDLWLLFPLGIGVNRLLKRTGDIPKPWKDRLNLLLGTTDWYDEFYRTRLDRNLFGTPEETVVKATMDTIARYFNDRLKSIFAGVAEQPAVLKNSANCPLYLLCFAVGNPGGKNVALRIANHLLKKVR